MPLFVPLPFDRSTTPILHQAIYHAEPETVVAALLEEVPRLPVSPGLTAWQVQEVSYEHVTLAAELLVGVPGLPCEVTVDLRRWDTRVVLSCACPPWAEERRNVFLALAGALDKRLGQVN